MIVIGTSLGGMRALQELLSGLPQGFDLPVSVVIHRHRGTEDFLVEFMQKICALPVREVVDKDPVKPGTVYFAPADYHLLVEGGSFSLSIDELVQFARPSIDVLFDSAAESCGPETIAVVLTGANYDGVNGARKVLQSGGTVVVENPETATCPVLPQAVLAACSPQYVLDLQGIAPLLSKLTGKVR